MQGAFCRAPNGGRRGRLSHRRWCARCEGSRAWTRVRLVRALRPLLQEGDRLRPLVGVGSPMHLRVGKRRVREWAKTPILDATPKTPTPIAFTPNLFHRMGGLRKGNDGPNVFGCDRSVRGIDFLAASGFNDVSSTGILTYS